MILQGLGAASPLTIVETYAAAATPVPQLGRKTMSAADQAAITAAQGICNRAADAKARNSPAYADLAAQCAASRAANVAAGRYYVDAMSPNDAAYRVALTAAGEAAIAKNPALAQARANVPLEPDGSGAERRGFTIAQGVRAGLVDPQFPAWVLPALAGSPTLLKGFTEALAAPAPGAGPGLTQATQPQTSALDNIPRPVLIAGAVGAAAAVGLIAFKLLKKKR